MKPKDIRQLALPRTVFVLAPGPSAIDAVARIPKGSMIFKVNKAIMIPVPRCEFYWVCKDIQLKQFDWFRENYKKYQLRTCFCGKLAKKFKPAYLFPGSPIIFNSNKFKQIDFGDFQTYGGATISCRAVQLFALLGVERIVLCGVDMRGLNHYDSSRAIFRDIDIINKDIWTKAEVFKYIIQWIRRINKRVEIYSMFESPLDLPLYNY